jgi:hypothetical protein
MANNKANRPLSLAQPHAQPKPQPQFAGPKPKRRNPNPSPQSNAPEQKPVKAHAYHAIAELNAGFEKVLQDLKALQPIGYLNTERLAAMADLIARLRAEANQDLITVLQQRETANAEYFGGLCRQREEAAGS